MADIGTGCGDSRSRRRPVADVGLSIAWALWLGLLCLVVHAAMAGSSSSGPMNMDFSSVILTMMVLPTLLLAPLALRLRQGRRLTVGAGWAVLAIGLWWVFWLPASMTDVSYSLRYDVNSPYIWPASPAVQMGVICLGAWFKADWVSRPWRGVALGLAWTVPVAFSCDGLIYADSGLVLGVAGALIAGVAWGVWRTDASAHPLRVLMAELVGASAGLVFLWFALYRWSDQLPGAVNAFGRGLIYPGS